LIEKRLKHGGKASRVAEPGTQRHQAGKIAAFDPEPNSRARQIPCPAKKPTCDTGSSPQDSTRRVADLTENARGRGSLGVRLAVVLPF